MDWAANMHLPGYEAETEYKNDTYERHAKR